jgi:hypothetical protein
MLDGFILIFIGYNSSILNKVWKWHEDSTSILNVIYHLVSAFGGVFSIYTTHISTKNGLNYAALFLMVAFILTIPLLNIKTYLLYIIIFSVICFSNGHLQNICTNLIVKKFSKTKRAAVYVFAYFFTQFGKFLFALIIYSYNEFIISGNLTVTILPIFVIIGAQIVVNIILINDINIKSNLKNSITKESIEKPNENQFVNINIGEYVNLHLLNEMENIPENNFKMIFIKPIKELFNNHNREHTLDQVFLNLSLGIQFFSMINVFSHLKVEHQDLVSEIVFSKTLHTFCLLFLPLFFLIPNLKRRDLLFYTFSLNLVLNICMVLRIFNPTTVIHIFRFIWNVCFITINLYCCESTVKNLRGVNTSVMYFIFKVSCVVEIFTIDFFISINLILPILLNIIILFGDIILSNTIKHETHMKSLEEIEAEIKVGTRYLIS